MLKPQRRSGRRACQPFFPGRAAQESQDLIRRFMVTFRGLILQALHEKRGAEAAQPLPQAAGLLPCGAFVWGLVGGTGGHSDLLETVEDLDHRLRQPLPDTGALLQRLVSSP